MHVTYLYESEYPVISMEFFPPRNEKSVEAFGTVIRNLKEVEPDYMSVTFGAGGSTINGSHQTVKTLIETHKQPTVAYMAGFGLSTDTIREVLDRYKELGVETIFVIRGDKPKENDFVPHQSSFSHASDMIAFIKSHYDFTLGCAGYPEGHLESKSIEEDILALKLKVENGADYIVSQYFYDNDMFFRFVDRCRAKGIGVPIIPGIMPVYTLKMTEMLSKVCGATITDRLREQMDAVNPNDKEAILKLGVDFSTEQCKGLLEKDVQGLHFYTMNRYKSTVEIMSQLKSEKLI